MSKGNGKLTAQDMVYYEPAQMPPNSQEAEEALLGAILINPDMLLLVMVFLKIEHFFVLRNAWIYEAMLRLHERGETIDYIPVVEELRAQKRLDDIGGAAYVTYLTGVVGNSFDAPTFAEIVYRAGIRREMLDAGDEIKRLALAEDQTLGVVIDAAEDTLSQVTGAFRRAKHSGLKPVVEVVEVATDRYPYPEADAEQAEIAALSDAYDAYQDSLKNVLKPGYTDLDKIIRFVTGLYHICGRPRVGKSMVMQNIIYNILLDLFVSPVEIPGGIKLIDTPVWLTIPTRREIDNLPTLAMFSAEMTTDQIMARWTAMITGVSTQKQLTGDMTFDEFRNVDTAKKLLKSLESRLLITSGTITPALIRSEVRLWRPGLAFVDYTQKLKPGIDRYRSKTDEISYICGELQDIALTEAIPLVSGAQINREGSSAPALENLKGSGSIEEDSDVVMLLHRPELYEENCTRPNMLDIYIAKNRNGETGVVELFHRKSIMRLANATKINLDELEAM